MPSRILVLLLILLSLLAGQSSAWAAGDGPVDGQPLSSAEIASLESVELTSAGPNSVTFKNGVTFFLEEPHSQEQFAVLSKLSPQQQRAFFDKRIKMITPIAKLFAFFGQRWQAKMQKRITAINNEFYKHASIISDSSEFGLNISLGLMGGAGVHKYGLFLTSNIGLAVGYDHEHKTTVIDLYLDLETLERAYPVVAEVAVNSNIMAYASNEQRELVQKGRYFSPPVIPVASDDFPSAINVGYSMGIGIPPLDWLYAYSGNKTRISLLKLKVPVTASGWSYKNIRAQTAVSVVIEKLKAATVVAKQSAVKSCQWLLKI